MAQGALARQLLEQETQAWRGMAPAQYDHIICGLLDQASAAPPSAEAAEALLALASATLRRNGPILTESRARCAEHLLALVGSVSEPALQLRIRLLLLLAWLQLGTVVARAPQSVSMTPDLPPGVMLPNGADPEAISDPGLREQAREMAVRHSEAVERWNARQRALGHLHRLATLLRAARPVFADDEDASKELAAAMSLAPGLPSALRQQLEDEAK
ncbi:MAG: hypothetical protein QOD09_3849 [Bradyrhizobium sp.]|jgi:hypothetical protein|nr:hypothetical protein [Bradyrhizobium sp.]